VQVDPPPRTPGAVGVDRDQPVGMRGPQRIHLWPPAPMCRGGMPLFDRLCLQVAQILAGRRGSAQPDQQPADDAPDPASKQLVHVTLPISQRYTISTQTCSHRLLTTPGLVSSEGETLVLKASAPVMSSHRMISFW